MAKINDASYIPKEVKKLPKGATILSKENRIRVEEIENGFLVIKDTEIKYSLGKDKIDWMYINQKYYSKDNPLTIDLKGIPLSDKFE
jgi:hypothetical protein